jgi:nicotinamidase-related amidase
MHDVLMGESQSASQLELSEHAHVVVDVQRGFADPVWGRRNNPECEANIEALLGEWRRVGATIVLVKHDSTMAGSPLQPGQAGNDLQDLVTGEPDLLVTKSVNSSFHGSPDLDAWL